MPDINPTLALRELVYHDMKPFYIVGFKVVPALTDNKVMYTISQDMPGTYGIGRGVWPNINMMFDREELKTQIEYDAAKIEYAETLANAYEMTLTGIPIITVNDGLVIKYVFDGNESFPWDGESYPPYDPLSALPLGSIWWDSGGSVTDQEDLGHALNDVIAHHVALISWDGFAYAIDNPEFNLYVTITHTFDNVTTVVPNVNLSVIGEYDITYEVFDNQRIHSYPVTRTVSVSEVPVPPTPVC